MALTEIKSGDEAKSSVLNDNFEYLDDRITSVGSSISSIQSSLQSQIQTVNTNLTSQVTTTMTSLLPAGSIIPWGGATIPTGFLKCDGSSVSRSTYSKLFSAIGTIYGSTDSTNFLLPDFRGKFLRGYGGQSASIGTVQLSGAPNIKGTIKTVNKHDNYGASGAFTVTTGGIAYVEPETNSSHRVDTFTFNASRSSSIYQDGLTEVRPDNYAVNFVIKY